ncbi:acyl-CoA dehydrogenase family protein [Sphingomonas paeninsulae]|uniref:acyl-CoA dehydrogenase family protein n=1 Tax=Sphingomonas paeninsulae TaxID=2319844 RepID=UPI003D330A03
MVAPTCQRRGDRDLCLCRRVGGWTGAALKATFEGGKVSGVKTPVADGGIAGLAVVLVNSGGKPALALVELDQAGVTRTKLDSFDQLRAHYTVRFDGATAELLNGPTAGQAIDRLFDRAAVQAAFEAVGGAEACLTMARDYALDRQIFGRALAGYQAIKHKLADILVGVELARSNAYYAAWAAENAADELPLAASAARLTAIGAFENAARENIQVHGGIGYTFEANCHFYYRRERTLALSLGGREPWANRLIANIPGAQAQGNLQAEAA